MRILTLLSLCAILVLGVFFFADRGQSDDTGPSLFGIPLVPPIFAQSGGSTLPDSEAGLSLYTRLDDPSLIDFAIIKTVLKGEIRDEGENYLIGSMNIPRATIDPGPEPLSIPVRVYVDTDGFIIAYLTKDKLAAEIFRWYLFDPIVDPLDTVLSDALAEVTNVIGDPPHADVSWYHWNYPSATRFSAAAKKGVGNMYMRIPAGTTFSENSYSWHTIRRQFGDTPGSLTLETADGTRTELESSVGSDSRFHIGELSSITSEGRYIFEMRNGLGGSGENFLGVALIYQLP